MAGVLAVCEAIAVAVQLQNVDVMGQPVEQRAGQPVRAEDLGPFDLLVDVLLSRLTVPGLTRVPHNASVTRPPPGARSHPPDTSRSALLPPTRRADDTAR